MEYHNQLLTVQFLFIKLSYQPLAERKLKLKFNLLTYTPGNGNFEMESDLKISILFLEVFDLNFINTQFPLSGKMFRGHFEDL